VARIDHGVQAIHDEALMARLAKERVPLTVCPLSNQKLCVFPSLADHNLRQMLELGLCVMLNSDDPAYFGGYVNDNYLQTFAALNLEASHAYQLALNSFEASFVSQDQKNIWRQQLDDCFAQFGA
jgi:adenosine deaminase